MNILRRRVSLTGIVATIIMKSAFICVVLFSACTGGKSDKQTTDLRSTLLGENFHSVPDSDKVWVYYWWLKGNVTRESITQDLEEMKKKGIGGFLLFDSRGYYDDYSTGIIPVPLQIKMEFMSPEWREMVKFTMQEAGRLGLEMSINLANTGGSLRGPWDLGQEGPKKLIWTSATFHGPGELAVNLKAPGDKKYFKDEVLIAVKIKSNKGFTGSNPEVDLNGKWHDVVAPGEGAPVAEKIIYLETLVKDNRINWHVPEGEWQILRFAYSVIADKGSVDILNKAAVTKYFTLIGTELLNDAGSLAGKTLKYFYNVSWEGGEPNWTLGFDKEFSNFRGYNIWEYMPVMAGIVVGDHTISKRFQRDYYRTVSDCFIENCYKTIGKLCHARGVNWHSENGGPWQRDAAMFKEADMLTFWGANDVPQGEFWAANIKDLTGKTNARFTSMAAHIYGQRLSAIEAFTHMTTHWSKYPGFLKQFADINYVDGSNMFIWHTFTASPPEIGKPGFEYFAGTHINPRVTWWEMSGDFITYLGRCQNMLRQGMFVADVCCYVSDKNYVRWGRGKKWNEKSSLYTGQGYTYDLITTEVLVNRLSVKNGWLILPDGMSYKLLVIDPDEQAIPAEALKKIIELARNGATVILGQSKPDRTPGLKNYPECDDAVKKMADELWGMEPGKLFQHPLGEGTVIAGAKMEDVLKEKNILPDFDGPFEYIHRSSNDLDIYFICGTGKAECTFRVEGKKPEIWNPLNGSTSDAVNYHFTDDGRTVVPVDLPENGSVFIVFSRNMEKNFITTIKGPESGLEIQDRLNDTLKLVLWKSGDYSLTTSRKKTQELKAEVPDAEELSGSWELSFTPGWGAPEKITFNSLTKWNDNPDKGIKYYSGTAKYRKTFILSTEQAGSQSRLQLGKVFNIAHIRLNNYDLGVVWTAPWTVDISEAIKQGENQLEIEVANCWANRLIGDAGLPENKRLTRTNVRLLKDRGEYRDYQAFSAKDTLLPSGLVGPVIVEFGEKKEVVF